MLLLHSDHVFFFRMFLYSIYLRSELGDKPFGIYYYVRAVTFNLHTSGLLPESLDPFLLPPFS